MLIEQTLEKLTAMKLGAMAEAVQQQLGSDVGTSPVNPLSIDIVLAAPYHPRPAPVAHLRSLGGDAGGASHYIPAYPGISRYISVYLGSFFLFAGTKAAAR